jgi:Family of unknown function (DUF5994)
MSTPDQRRSADPIRLTVASHLGVDLDGAWWPHSSSEARELPKLIEALRERVGEVIDIGVNWSTLDGVPDLDSLSRVSAIPGQQVRNLRVITVTGRLARVKLLVIPPRTTRALAVMLLRQAAALPIHPMHVDTSACRAADDIVRAARSQCALSGTIATTSA